jgi:hypothetical protein
LRPRSWTDDQLRAAVAASTRLIDVLRRLDLSVGGGTLDAVRNRIIELGIDCSHLVEDSDYLKSAVLRKRLVREGLKEPRCEICGRDEWMERPIPLQLDHVNGDRTDNRLENLRILCPNCHALTDTYCGKNIGRAASTLRATMSKPQAPVVEGQTRGSQTALPTGVGVRIPPGARHRRSDVYRQGALF